MKSVILYFLTGVLALAVDITLGEIENGFAKSAADPKILTISIIEQEKANTLFREFSQNKDIPFKYPIDGCYARATAMARMAEQEQVQMGKVYAEGSLQVKTESAKYPFVQWGWHVAPIAYVKQRDGTTVLEVFDPSLFSKPVPVEDWKNRMLDKSNGYQPAVRALYYGTRFQYYPKDEGYKDKWSQRDLDGADSTMKRYSPLQDLAPPVKSAGGQQPNTSAK